jgi:predicted ATPase
MSGSSQLDFRNVELDADLLTTPYGVHTNWHVITGAPSCGKTTLINLLADKGFQIAPEAARLYLEREMARGRSLEEIRSKAVNTERGIADMQLEIERGLYANDCIFLDRAIPDCLAWYRFFGMDPNELLRECFHNRYASVFILDQLPLQQNGLRYKDATLQVHNDKWHTRDYTALGYNVTRVPVMPPEERLAFVLRVLTEQGLIEQ